MTNLKTLALAAVTIAATVSSASAYNAFPFGDTFEPTGQLALDFVRADAAGKVEIYDYHAGVRGELLGSEIVRGGLNTDVKIDLGIGANSNILIVLNVDGADVLTKDLMIR